MRKFLLVAVLAAAPACRHATVPSAETIEEAPRLASSLRMNDRTMAHQLVSGFYDVESGAWRWTAQKFSVNLRPPARSAQTGAVLELHLSVPATTIQQLGSVALSANAGDAALAPEPYSKAGNYVYRRDVPASALTGDSVRIDFQLDKAIPPGEADKRELGIIAASVGLVAK